MFLSSNPYQRLIFRNDYAECGNQLLFKRPFIFADFKPIRGNQAIRL